MVVKSQDNMHEKNDDSENENDAEFEFDDAQCGEGVDECHKTNHKADPRYAKGQKE